MIKRQMQPFANNPNLTDWSKGPPPFIGEWNASMCKAENSFRWWDGKCWSGSYSDTAPLRIKRKMRRTKSSFSSDCISWRGLAEKPEGFTEPLPLESK